ncbi:DUF3159 domain-containing protein [Knoellia sp. p5-6-4]|uniref:DUF3159 domain-containing protein n=1 Tax=unclassified Knoellia TaxID=2618719 RepID=UPI0023DA99DC|nr:DUF3159 domain-containing protein [Knoellia sp. p5-6-4]MDF2143585.1 DUF3159 domain-containing protein [Knoellia sp. p5-6-4]
MATEQEPVAATHPAPTVEEVIRHRLSTALGGWRGSIESALPMVAFVVVWTWQKDIMTAVVTAGVLTAVLAVVAVVQRQSLQFILSAVFATAIAAFFALRSGRAEDAFLPGILTSAAWGVGTLVSVLVRWPVVGFMVGVGDPRMAEDPFAWRRDPGLVRVCQRLTMVLVALYAVRVAIMLPLYFAGQVAWLGVAKVALGWPAWVVAVAVMGWMLLRGQTPQVVPAPDSEQTWQAAHHAGGEPRP